MIIKYNTIIIGAGASGLMCAQHLNKDYIILEKTNSSANKLLLTGNGRCNLLNLKPINEFISNINHNSKSLYSTLNNFSPSNIYDYFSKHIPLTQEDDNRIYPKSNKSIDIKNILINNVNIKYNTEVLNIIPVNNSYKLITNNIEYFANNIVVATGGCSYPHTGSNGIANKFANSLNINTIDYYPCETSIITINPLTDLAGTSFDNVLIKANKHISFGNLIFTHTGLSGSSIMLLSEHIYKEKIDSVTIDLLPNTTNDDLINILTSTPEKQLTTILHTFFSKKFTLFLLSKNNLNQNILIKQLNSKQINSLISLFKNYTINILKVNDIKNAIISGGGINIKELDPKTFCSKTYKNLYFIGECVDIHGPIGGYNLTLAFSMAYSAALSINKE